MIFVYSERIKQLIQFIQHFSKHNLEFKDACSIFYIHFGLYMVELFLNNIIAFESV